MQKIYLDTEFSGFGGWLISLALVVNEQDYLYLVRPMSEVIAMEKHEPMDPWVCENVVPILFDIPGDTNPTVVPFEEWGRLISNFLYKRASTPEIVADWPDDIRYLMELLITGPGQSVPMGDQTHFTIIRHVDIYPTDLPGAVQHNALWDALAIKHFVEN